MNIKKVVTKNTLDFSIEDIEEINDAFYVYKDLSSEEIKKLTNQILNLVKMILLSAYMLDIARIV